MTTISHEPLRERHGWALGLAVAEMWASLAIMVMWLAVLFDAVYGPNMTFVSSPTSNSTIPSAVAVGLFAFLGTAAVAKRGFGGREEQDRGEAGSPRG